MMNKKGFALMSLLMLAALVTVGWLAYRAFTGNDMPVLSAAPAPTTPSGMLCAKEDVTGRYDTLDFYEPTQTDPGDLRLWIITDYLGAVSAGSSKTLSTNYAFDALAGENASKGSASSYFVTPLISKNTGCNDPYDLNVKLYPSGQPTMTVIDSDGVTKNNAAGGNETVGANSKVDVEVVVKAPSRKCSANPAPMAGRPSASLVLEYVSTYWDDFSATGTKDGNSPDYLTHYNATFDRYKTFDYYGSLCDGNKASFVVRLDSSATDPAGENARLYAHWVPHDYFVDEDGSIGYGMENYANAIIAKSNMTQWVNIG